MTPRRIRVTVTQDDIDHGMALKANSCPIALALHRQGYDEACVHAWGWCPKEHSDHAIRGQHDGFAGRYHISERAHAFVRAYDIGLKVVPSIFYLDITDR